MGYAGVHCTSEPLLLFDIIIRKRFIQDSLNTKVYDLLL